MPRRALICAAVAAASLAAGCHTPSGDYPRSTPLIPAASVRISEGYTVSLEKLVTYAGVATAVYLVLDPLAPNWSIEQMELPDETYQLSLRTKRFRTGGDGEGIQVFRRRAAELARSQGQGGYEVLRYEESIESATLGAQRAAVGAIRITPKTPG